MPKLTARSVPTIEPIRPFWQTTDGTSVRLYQGNAVRVLERLPAKSVQCVVTSPPYWGLRDYGTGTWEGGVLECDHLHPPCGGKVKGATLVGSGNRSGYGADGQYRHTCGKCGANRVDHQLGNEPMPEGFVANMVEVFRGVRRVLRDDGVVWLNLGDTYVSHAATGQVAQTKNHPGSGHNGSNSGYRALAAGNLVGIPWRVALALQADGWVLRSDIIWHKPSAMPESVKNRCSKAHEYVFMLTKSMDYFCDMEAIKEKRVTNDPRKPYGSDGMWERDGREKWEQGVGQPQDRDETRKNKRSVWSVCTQAYSGSHFAVFPPKLITPMILAGTSERGCCASCGAPVLRVVEETKLVRERPNDYVKRTGQEGTGNSISNSVAGVETKTVGWEPSCSCGVGTVPCTVLDPFIGSGTTAAVSLSLGRHCWGIDLSETYLRGNAVPRITDTVLGGGESLRGLVEVPAVRPVIL